MKPTTKLCDLNNEQLSTGSELNTLAVEAGYSGIRQWANELNRWNDTIHQVRDSIEGYSGYTVRLSTYPGFYGADCTEGQAQTIVDDLSIRAEWMFAGIDMQCTDDQKVSAAITGPDDDTREYIAKWIEENRTKSVQSADPTKFPRGAAPNESQTRSLPT